MGRKKIQREKEGEVQSMKELTKDHDTFMKSRPKDRQEEEEDPKEKFDNLLKKAVKK